ncbi:MAG: class I SAM-dependent methyltransferase [Anaerolineae bacterium]|nr:class I SAM-dependent methyltransferase [Anaerolineae bacterium]
MIEHGGDPARVGQARLRSVLSLLPAVLPHRILNVGCGSYLSARTLHGARPGWTLWGLDRDGYALRHARIAAPDLRLRLVQADAIHLPDLLHTRFGLVLVRHPDLHRNRATWSRVIPALRGLVAPGGVLLITVYMAGEVDLLRELALPGPVQLDESALTPVGLDGQDRFAFAYNG